MKKKQINTVMLLVIFLASCYGTVGKNFDSSDLKSIQNNVTSQEEIFERLGAPFKKGIENGHAIWTYQFDQWNAVGPTRSKDLVILFDKENIVEAYRYTTSNP
jgi:hypothetical protein